MERVAFLIPSSGQHLGCLLNPESLTLRRSAGVVPRRGATGLLGGGAAAADDPLLFTGGGRTELELELLFDVALVSVPTAAEAPVRDVRELTRPLWELAENRPREDARRPAAVRFIWGKAWNLPVVVVAAAERLERFTAVGVPQRSWLRLRLWRDERPPAQPAAASPPPPGADEDALPGSGGPDLNGPDVALYEVAGETGGARLDLVAAQRYGQASWWKWLAGINDLDDPLRLEPGRLLRLPPADLPAAEGGRADAMPPGGATP